MRRLLTFIILVPIAILLIVFAVANRHPVLVSLDPFSPEDPALALTLPLFILLFLTLLIGVLVGGISAWASQGKWRSEARHNRIEARRWRTRASEMEAEQHHASDAPGLPAPRAAR